MRVAAVAVNPVDTKVRGGGPSGQPVANPPRIIGWDAVGEVAALGSEARRFQVGNGVFCAGSGDVGRQGSYAEYVAVDERKDGQGRRRWAMRRRRPYRWWR